MDGVDLRQYHPSDIRRGVGFVMQYVTLFFGSVRDNIALGAPQAEDHMILRAARLAGVDEFIGRPPQCSTLQAGERGADLSGGPVRAIAARRAAPPRPPALQHPATT